MLKELNRSKRKEHSIDMEITTISPQVAQAYLDKNNHNRKKYRSVVSSYARDMKEGRWVLTGEPIQFDEDGHLINGQHRLSACVEADTPFTTVVCYGVAKPAQSVMDSGKARTANDVLSLSGFHSGWLLGGAARHIIEYSKGGGLATGNFRWTNAEIMEATNRHKALPASANLIASFGAKKVAGFPASTLAFLHYVGTHMLGLPDRANAFVNVFVTGVPDYEGDPAHILRDRLLRERMSRAKISRRERIAGIVHAWNKFVVFDKSQNVRIPKGPAEVRGLDREAL
jgi:hypothetical protein